MSQTVQQLVAKFQSTSTEGKDICQVVAPTSSISVKQLINTFEAKFKGSQHTDKEDIQENNTTQGMRGENTIHSNVVKTGIVRFENLAHEGIVERDALSSLETAAFISEEGLEDGSKTINPMSTDISVDKVSKRMLESPPSKLGEMEIQGNEVQTAQGENPRIFHINAPASTPGHSVHPTRVSENTFFRKLSGLKLGKLVSRLSIFKKNSGEDKESTIPSAPVQDGSMNVTHESAEFTTEKPCAKLLETAPHELDEGREDGTQTVNPTTSESTPGHSTRLNTAPAKNVWQKVFSPRLFKVVSRLTSSETNSRETLDGATSATPTIPTHLSISIPANAPGDAKSIELTLSVTSVSFK